MCGQQMMAEFFYLRVNYTFNWLDRLDNVGYIL